MRDLDLILLNLWCFEYITLNNFFLVCLVFQDLNELTEVTGINILHLDRRVET